MKKYFILISAAIMALACTKELTDNQKVYDGEYKTITFESVMTKTTLADDGAVAWESGDQISIYYVNAEGAAAEAVATATAAGATATFTTQIPIQDAPAEFYAAYPAGSGIFDSANGKFYLNVLPEKCNGTFKSANFSAAYTTADDMALQFHNAVGMIRLALPEGGKFTKDGVDYTLSGVYMRGQASAFNNKQNNGPVEFNASDATFGEPVAVTIGETTYEKGVANINLKGFTSEVLSSGYAYIPSLPGTWPTGLCIRYYAAYADKKGGALPAVLSKPNEISIERGQILKLADQTSKIQINYYVSPDGEGDGLTETTPMNLAKMQELISATKDYQFNAYLLDNAVFNLADGTYTLASTITIPTPKTLYKLTIKGDNGKAILDGGTVSTGTGDKRATVETPGKQVLYVNTSTNILFDGITFQNGYAENGGAVQVAYTANTTDANSTLKFTNCRFLRNIASTGLGGAMLVANAAAGGIITFDRCYFKDNQTLAKAKSGGSFYSNGAKMAVMFNKCTFHKNKAYEGGMEIHMNNAGARLAMNNCTFNGYNWNNTNDGTPKNGSLITNKGYTVIANSTLWNSQFNGDWGSFALGCTPGTNGATIVNSVIRNAKTQNAIYVAGNYNLNIKYSIFTGIKEGVNSPVLGETYFVSDCYDLGLAGAVVGAGGIDKTSETLPYYAYKWSWVDGYPCPTCAQVRAEIKNTAEIGQIFLDWLDTLGDAFTTDIAGNARPDDAMCPGSYQQTDTPAGK